MLEPIFLTSAIPLNQSLAEKNQFIYAIPGTPLSMLVRQTPSLGNTPDSSYDSLIKQLVDLSRSENHADVLVRVKQLAVSAVREVMNFTRNTANPHIRRVIDDYDELVSNAKGVDAPYVVDSTLMPEVYHTSAARELVTVYDGAITVTEPTDFYFGHYEPQEILNMVQVTDAENFNELLNELLTEQQGANLDAICQLLRGERRFSSLPPKLALPVAVIANAIETPREGVQSSLTAYNSARLALGNVGGKSTLRQINMLNDSLQNNVLYLRGPVAKGGTIEVNGEVYNRLIEQGLDVDVLFGNELTGRRHFGKSLLDPEIAASLRKAYEDDKAIREEAHHIDMRRVSRNAVLQALKNDHAKIVADKSFPIEGDDATKSFQRMNSLISSTVKGPNLTHEPTNLIAAVICGTWYAHTHVARVIDIGLDLGKRHPKSSPEELALLTTIRYIAEWVASMVTLGVDEPVDR